MSQCQTCNIPRIGNWMLLNTAYNRLILLKLRWEDPIVKSLHRLSAKIEWNVNKKIFRPKTFLHVSFKDETKCSGKFIRSLFNELNTLRKRENRKKLEFVWKIEQGKKTNRLHFHCILNRFIPKRELDIFRNRCGHVWIEWIKTDEAQKAINYVKKYISKNAKLVFDKIPPKMRIWSTSRGLVKKPKADLLAIFDDKEMGINELCSYKEFFGELVR